MGTKKEIQKNLNTRKRSQEGEKSQSSSNFPDPKRRKRSQEMDNSEWIPHDQALLTLFGNVRHGVDTSLGKTYDVAFYINVSERLSGSQGIAIGDKDVVRRLKTLKEVFRGNPWGVFTHEVMTSEVYGGLLRRCFEMGVGPIKFPKIYFTTSSGTSRQSNSWGTSRQSTGRGAASSERAVDSLTDSFTERAADALLHIYNQHSASISPERITLFGRFLNDSRNRIPAEMFLKMNHEAQVAYISSLNLDFYADL